MCSASKNFLFSQFYQLASSLGDDARQLPTRQSHGVASGHIFGDYLLIRIAVMPLYMYFFKILFPHSASVNEIFLG